MELPRTLRLVLALAVTLVSGGAVAYPLSYSGRLSDSTGRPLAGKVDLSFAFYAGATGGSALGTGMITKDAVDLIDGVFQVDLTISDVEAAAIFADPSTPVYIEVKDVTHDKTYPRQRFNVIPYALRVPVDGMTIGYTADGRLESLVDSSSGDIAEVVAGTGLLGGGASGSVTLSLDPTAIPASEPPIAAGTAAQYRQVLTPTPTPTSRPGSMPQRSAAARFPIRNSTT